MFSPCLPEQENLLFCEERDKEQLQFSSNDKSSISILWPSVVPGDTPSPKQACLFKQLFGIIVFCEVFLYYNLWSDYRMKNSFSLNKKM